MVKLGAAAGTALTAAGVELPRSAEVLGMACVALLGTAAEGYKLEPAVDAVGWETAGSGRAAALCMPDMLADTAVGWLAADAAASAVVSSAS